MPIPGKYCFGILEEDNPLKSYFRFKPLLIENEGKYESFVEGDAYPEDGCIRIVPDKNESSRFKARMRRLGRYAVVDLRAHPNENDKIRPNKNYRGDGIEQNANIIYSDVVQAPLSGSVLEVLDLDVPEDSTNMALTMPMPATSHVLVRGNDGALNVYIWAVEAMEAIEGGVALKRTEMRFDPKSAPLFDVPGFHGEELHFVLATPDERLIELRTNPEEETTEKPAPAAVPAAPEAVEGREAEPTRPAPAAEAVQRAVPETTLPDPAPLSAPEAGPVSESEPSPAPRSTLRAEHAERGHGRPTSSEQALLMQTGLNPRRGRSLQEIIDEKWRHSRLDQLGHPVPPEASGNPVASPVDRALFAVREAWSNPDTRPSLCAALNGIDGLALGTGASAAGEGESSANSMLNDLEAQRLKLLDEIATLKAGRIETHEKIVAEIRAGNARLFEEGEKKLQAQRQELERLERKVGEAAAARKSAEEALAALTGEEGKKRLNELALGCSALKIGGGSAPAYEAPAIGHAETTRFTAGELISHVRGYFENVGFPLDNDEAVNLLAAFALSPITILSGAPGSGKSSMARFLAEALGISGAKRCASLRPGRGPLEETPAFRELTACTDQASPILALLDDANLRPGPAAECLCSAFDAPDANPALRLMLTVQDAPAGYPLDVRLLDRAFLLRLKGEAAETDWAPRPLKPNPASLPVSEESLREIFAPDPESIPETVVLRMQKLRAGLATYGVRLSRRTLTAIWNYCAATTRLMQRDALAVFDLGFAQRALPFILAAAPLEALHKLPELLADLPESLRLLGQPLPLEV